MFFSEITVWVLLQIYPFPNKLWLDYDDSVIYVANESSTFKAQPKTVTLPNAILGEALSLRASEFVSLANVFLAKRQNGVVESPKRGPQSNCQQPQPQKPRTHFEQ